MNFQDALCKELQQGVTVSPLPFARLLTRAAMRSSRR